MLKTRRKIVKCLREVFFLEFNIDSRFGIIITIGSDKVGHRDRRRVFGGQ